MKNTSTLSRGQIHRALNSFVVASGGWGAWGQSCGLGTAAFTGFALHLGADDSFIALFTSAAYFLALTQLLAPMLSARVSDKKRFVVVAGCAFFLPRLFLFCFFCVLCLRPSSFSDLRRRRRPLLL